MRLHIIDKLAAEDGRLQAVCSCGWTGVLLSSGPGAATYTGRVHARDATLADYAALPPI